MEINYRNGSPAAPSLKPQDNYVVSPELVKQNISKNNENIVSPNNQKEISTNSSKTIGNINSDKIS